MLSQYEEVKKIVCEICLKASGFSKCQTRIFPDCCDFCLTRSLQICQLFEPTELKLRALLWAAHACDGKYSDDGELQCGRFLPPIDFKRDSPEEIDRKIPLHYQQLREEPKPNQYISCPFCGDNGEYDKIGLKYHLRNYCREYQDTEDLPL